jgi:membrane-bound lytic murein transglycosylase D
MTKTIFFRKIYAASFFAFCCTVLSNYPSSAQQQLPPWVHTDQQVLPDQFDSNDSLNITESELATENEPVEADSIMEAKVSFADVDVPTFTDSIYKSRLGAIATPIPLLYNEEVRKYIDLYVLNRREQVARMLGLAKIYFPVFDQIFAEFGVPAELKYLSIIESALNPHAVSKAGATGMWQFMYGTAKVYGLNMNNYIDERRDIIRSTEGAAQYLKSMYAVYGDWLLAVASYNCGPGNVNKAISLSGGKTFWEIRNYLPKETRNYVPAFIAATYVMNYYELHDLHPTYPKYSFDGIATVEVSEKMSSEHIAKFTGLTMDEFKFLNPGLKCNVIPATATSMYLCKLPSDCVDAFDQKKDSIVLLSVNVKPTFYSGFTGGTSTTYYTVKKGDNLGKIAGKYHVTVSQLKKWNNLKGTTIRAGQRLKISRPQPSSSQTASAGLSTTPRSVATGNAKQPDTASNKTITASASGSTDAGEVKALKPVIDPPVNKNISASDETDAFFYYKAKYGDTLWEIAQRHGTTVSEIIKINGPAKCNKLKAGTVLKLSSKG